MPKYRFKLQVTITTRDVVLQAGDRRELEKLIDNIPVEDLVRGFSDSLHIAVLGEVSRVMPSVEPSFTRKAIDALALSEKNETEPAKPETDPTKPAA